MSGNNITDLAGAGDGVNNPRGITVTDSFIYWTQPSEDKIVRSNLDGTGVTDLISLEATSFLSGIHALDGKLYWTDTGTYKIQSANLDGTGITDLVTGIGAASDIYAVPEPQSIAYMTACCVAALVMHRRRRKTCSGVYGS